MGGYMIITVRIGGGGVIFSVEEFLLTRHFTFLTSHFTTVGPGAIAFLGALVDSVGW